MKTNLNEANKIYKNMNKRNFYKTKNIFKDYKLDVECEKLSCPNRYECYSAKTASFILDNTSEKNHNVNDGVGSVEPYKIAEAVNKLSLKYVILTCQNVSEEIENSSMISESIRWIRTLAPNCIIEASIPNTENNLDYLKTVIKAEPDVVSHDIEMVHRLHETYKTDSDYNKSLEILREAKVNGLVVKSGLKVGLGEQQQEIIDAMQDIRSSGCDILTIGQYFQPSDENLDVKRFYRIQEFSFLQQLGTSMNFKSVIATPFATTSYKGHEAFTDSIESLSTRQAQ